MEDGLGALFSPLLLIHLIRLNPCFSGGWSRSIHLIFGMILQFLVLILVLVEDGLGDQQYIPVKTLKRFVLILVLVEDGLGVLVLNTKQTIPQRVLILVLVEDGLGD